MIVAIAMLNNFLEAQLIAIPDHEPDVRAINSTFLFKHKGDLHPILNYVHIRTRVSLANLSVGVHGIFNFGSNYKEYIEFNRIEKTMFPNGTENIALRRYKGVSLPSMVRGALDKGASP